MPHDVVNVLQPLPVAGGPMLTMQGFRADSVPGGGAMGGGLVFCCKADPACTSGQGASVPGGCVVALKVATKHPCQLGSPGCPAGPGQS